MDESDMTIANSQTLSKKQAVNGNNTNTATKSIMRPSRKTTDEHHKSRAKMLAVANSASKNGEYTFILNNLFENFRGHKGLFSKDKQQTNSASQKW